MLFRGRWAQPGEGPATFPSLAPPIPVPFMMPGGLLGPGFVAAGGLPGINIAGCPIHPGWFVDTVLQLAVISVKIC